MTTSYIYVIMSHNEICSSYLHPTTRQLYIVNTYTTRFTHSHHGTILSTSVRPRCRRVRGAVLCIQRAVDTVMVHLAVFVDLGCDRVCAGTPVRQALGCDSARR